MNSDNQNQPKWSSDCVFYEQHLRNIVQVLRTRMVLCSQVTEKNIFMITRDLFRMIARDCLGQIVTFHSTCVLWMQKNGLDFNTGLLYGIFSAGTCDRSTRRIRRIVQVGKKILKQFRFGDDDCVHCTQNCSTNANKQMRGRPRQNLQICFWHSHKEQTGYVMYSLTHTLKVSRSSARHRLK